MVSSSAGTTAATQPAPGSSILIGPWLECLWQCLFWWILDSELHMYLWHAHLRCACKITYFESGDIKKEEVPAGLQKPTVSLHNAAEYLAKRVLGWEYRWQRSILWVHWQQSWSNCTWRWQPWRDSRCVWQQFTKCPFFSETARLNTSMVGW